MIPPLVSYPSIDAFLSDLREVARRTKVKKGNTPMQSLADMEVQALHLWEAGLPPIASRRALSLLLGISPRLIPRMVVAPDLYWREFFIPKRTGGTRKIQTPKVYLKTIHLYILQNILSVKNVAETAYGFTRGRGAAACAAIHKQQAWILRLDIQDFFPSVSYLEVLTLFRSFGFTDEVAQTLTSLCTRNGVLPQGAPTSPRIADLVFRGADIDIKALATDYQLTYSRYADDMIFSGTARPSPKFQVGVVKLLENHGFQLNHEKTLLRGPTEQHRVLGFVINDKTHPARQTRRMLRSKFHNLKTGQLQPEETLAVAQGWASYVNAYDTKLGRRYLEIAKLASQRAEGRTNDPSLAPPHNGASI
jgi:RNA-directed DNA polymerase